MLLLLPFFFALVALVFFLQLSVLFDCRTRRTQTRIPTVAPTPASTPAATALPARSGADYLHAAIIFASVCVFFSCSCPALAWPGLLSNERLQLSVGPSFSCLLLRLVRSLTARLSSENSTRAALLHNLPASIIVLEKYLCYACNRIPRLVRPSLAAIFGISYL